MREHVPFRRGVVAGDESDEAWKAWEWPLALGREQALGGELLLQPFESCEMRAEAEALDREHLQPELPALLVQLGSPEHMDSLSVGELETQSVELPPRHLGREAGPVLGILEREEDRRPAVLPAQLRDLALDPQRRQALQPRGHARVEGAHGVDLAPFDLRRLDLHQADASFDLS